MNESRSADLRADFLEKWGPATVRPAVQLDLDALIDAVRAEAAAQASAAPPDEGLREALTAFDLHCENFIYGTERRYDSCFSNGRQAHAEYGADQACWPCCIRRALAADKPGSERETEDGVEP